MAPKSAARLMRAMVRRWSRAGREVSLFICRILLRRLPCNFLGKSRFLDCGTQKVRPFARNDSSAGVYAKVLVGKEITEEKAIAVDDFTRSNGNGRTEDRTVENESMEFTVFAARVGVWRKVAEEGIVEFTAGEAGVENFGVDASSDGAETLLMKVAD